MFSVILTLFEGEIILKMCCNSNFKLCIRRNFVSSTPQSIPIIGHSPPEDMICPLRGMNTLADDIVGYYTDNTQYSMQRHTTHPPCWLLPTGWLNLLGEHGISSFNIALAI